MDKLNSIKFKEDLLKLVRMDYHIKVYNYNDNIFTISFNHLNSYYNGLASVHINSTRYISINWQYHAKNKKAEKYIHNILNYIWTYKTLKNSYDWIIDELNYYNDLSQQIFNAKYNLDVVLHTINN